MQRVGANKGALSNTGWRDSDMRVSRGASSHKKAQTRHKQGQGGQGRRREAGGCSLSTPSVILEPASARGGAPREGHHQRAHKSVPQQKLRGKRMHTQVCS